MTTLLAAASFLAGLLAGMALTRRRRLRRTAGLTHWTPPVSGGGA